MACSSARGSLLLACQEGTSRLPAAARVTGELAATAALAGGEDVGTVASDLADVVREVARDHGEMLGFVRGEVAGRA